MLPASPILLLCLLSACASSSGSPPSDVTAPRDAPRPVSAPVQSPLPAAAAEDVESPEAIVAALYDVISGPAGTRDWDRLRSLFHPEFGRLLPVRSSADGTQHRTLLLSVEDYIQSAGAMSAQQAFYERSRWTRVERFGAIAQVFSAFSIYTSDAPDAVPFGAGVNSFQLSFDGERWFVLSVSWVRDS